MKVKNICIHNAFRLVCYTFATPADVEYFFATKGNKLFEVFDSKQDNVGYHLILKQAIDSRYSKIVPRAPVELRYLWKPNIGKDRYLKQNRKHYRIKVNWAFCVWEYIADTEEAVEQYRRRVEGKYIHINDIEPYKGKTLIRVFKQDKGGYRKYNSFFLLSDEESEAYYKRHRSNYCF